MGCVGEARLSELQLTRLRLARRKQEGGPALRAFMFINLYPVADGKASLRVADGGSEHAYPSVEHAFKAPKYLRCSRALTAGSAAPADAAE